jgi:ABC-type Mn2+/Zn2+ transport system permease subunit
MIVPATAARFWVNAVTPMILLAVLIGAGSGLSGLALSYWLDRVPSGPSIVLVTGGVFTLSLLLGQNGLNLAGRIARLVQSNGGTVPPRSPDDPG